MKASRRTAVALIVALLQVVPLVHASWGACLAATSAGCCERAPGDAGDEGCCHAPDVGASRPGCSCCDVPRAPAPVDGDPARTTLEGVALATTVRCPTVASVTPAGPAPSRTIARSPGAPPPHPRAALGVFLL